MITIRNHLGLRAKTDEERFFEKFDRRGPDECWEWKASKYKGGYGMFRHSGRTVRAHRFSYELENGKIPERMLVCHKCDKPACVNPGHLFLGSYGDNAKDRNLKGRTASKLSEDEVLEIRRLYKFGSVTHRELAIRYGVSRQNVTHIIGNRRWKHLNPTNQGYPAAGRDEAPQPDNENSEYDDPHRRLL